MDASPQHKVNRGSCSHESLTLQIKVCVGEWGVGWRGSLWLANQALYRQGSSAGGFGLGREEGHMHREVEKWQINLRNAKNLGGFKTGYCRK